MNRRWLKQRVRVHTTLKKKKGENEIDHIRQSDDPKNEKTNMAKYSLHSPKKLVI
jgi:hypothetical protein